MSSLKVFLPANRKERLVTAQVGQELIDPCCSSAAEELENHWITASLRELLSKQNLVGELVGPLVVGEAVGELVGPFVVGELVGELVGPLVVGDAVGELVGPLVVGELVGPWVVGEVVGEVVGDTVGLSVVGDVVGPLVVGEVVGDVVGATVTTEAHPGNGVNSGQKAQGHDIRKYS
jgi:hypothetical protein